MNISSSIPRFIPLALALLPLQAVAEVPPSEQAIDVSVWSIVESRCEETRPGDESVECRISAYRMTYKIGYTVYYTHDRNKELELMGAFVGATAGLGLPLLPFMDFSSSRIAHTTSEGDQRVLDMRVDEAEPVVSTSVSVRIDGSPIGDFQTGDDGIIRFEAPRDSVIELYAAYDKRSLALDQSLYYDGDGKMHVKSATLAGVDR